MCVGGWGGGVGGLHLALLILGLFQSPPLQECRVHLERGGCEDRVLDGPASGEKGSKGSN